MRLLAIALLLNIVSAINAAEETCVHIHYPSTDTPLMAKNQQINIPISHVSMPIDVVNIIEDYDDTPARYKSKLNCELMSIGCAIFVVSAGAYLAPFSSVGDDNELNAHLYFGASAGLTVSGYLMGTVHMLYERDKARIRERLALLKNTSQYTLVSTIGRGLKTLGKISFALGAPLLPMGIGWGSGEGFSTPEMSPSVSTEIKISKYSFLLGSGLTTAGTALWLSGNKLCKE